MAEWISQKERATTVTNEIMNAVNVMGSDKQVAEGILEAIKGSHRTLQQNYWRVMIAVIKGYAETNSDLRNEGAVNFCKDVVKFLEENPNKEYLPYV